MQLIVLNYTLFAEMVQVRFPWDGTPEFGQESRPVQLKSDSTEKEGLLGPVLLPQAVNSLGYPLLHQRLTTN